jgi:hypothetical protein
VLRVRVGLRDVLALAVEAEEAAVERGVEHVGDAQARLGLDFDAPVALEQLAGDGVGHVAIAGQLVREAAHVAGALHVVLAAQRIDADALAADVAGGHGEVGDGHHRGRALAVLGDAEAVVDRRVAALRIQPRRGAHRRAGTPVAASSASGEFSGRAMNSRQSRKALALAALARRRLRRPGPR